MIEKKYDCLGIGRSCLDYLALVDKHPRKNSKIAANKFLVEGGGQVATALVSLAKLGAKTKFIGKVGLDEVGKLILAKLVDEGVDIADVEKTEGIESPQALIIVEKNSGQRTIVYQKPAETLSKRIKSSIIKSSKSILIDPQETKIGIEAAKIARQNSIPVVYDAERAKPGIEKMIKLTTHLICDEDFAREFTGKKKIKDSLLKMQEFGPKVVIATLGERGSAGVTDNGEFLRVEACKKFVIKDTTGAGDAFHGAFIFGLISKWDLRTIMSFSSVVAVMNCRALGGREGLPSLSEALSVLKSYYKINLL